MFVYNFDSQWRIFFAGHFFPQKLFLGAQENPAKVEKLEPVKI